MSFLRNQLIILFTLLPCDPSKIVASLLLEVMIQNSVDHRSNEVRFTKNKTYKVGWTVRWKFTKLCLFLCFVPMRPLRIFWKKTTDVSVIQQPSSTSVGERRCLGTLRHWRWALRVGWSLVGFFLRCLSLFCWDFFSRGESIDSMMINVCLSWNTGFFWGTFGTSKM